MLKVLLLIFISFVENNIEKIIRKQNRIEPGQDNIWFAKWM